MVNHVTGDDEDTSSSKTSLQITEEKELKVNDELTDATSSSYQRYLAEPEYTDWQKRLNNNGAPPVPFNPKDPGSPFLKKVGLIHVSLRKKPREEIVYTAENPRRTTRILTPSAILISGLEYESNEKYLKKKSAKVPKVKTALTYATTGAAVSDEKHRQSDFGPNTREPKSVSKKQNSNIAVNTGDPKSCETNNLVKQVYKAAGKSQRSSRRVVTPSATFLRSIEYQFNVEKEKRKAPDPNQNAIAAKKACKSC